MSQRNLEIVRAGIGAYNHGDWDGMLEHAAHDFVLDMSRAIGPEQRGTFTLEEAGSRLEDIATTFESYRIEADELIDADPHVVVPITAHGTGRDGIEIQARTALVYTLADGAVTRIAMYQTRREALEAVGLRE